MALELSSIVFKATTDELDAAVKKIETLGKSVEGLASSLGKLDKASAETNKTQAQANLINAKAEKELAKAIDITDKTTAATERLTKATREKQSVEERQEAITRIMAEGYSRGQASILATAEAAGEATERTAELLKTQRAMQGVNPFDKSLGATTVFANETRVLTVASDLYAQGLGFTKSQLMELGREHVRLSEQFKIQGKDMGGLDAEFNKIVQSAQKVTQTENAMAAAMKNADKATVDAGKANAYIENELQKVRFALQANNEELNRSTSNSLVRFENALKKSGLTLDQQKVKIDEYRKAQVELQKTTSSNQTDYITRAVGPQITDIVVGLSTGQSPLTVMMQQGGQLRDQFGMMGIAAKDMGDVMRNAMKGMGQSVFDTGKAITTMLAGGMFDAGKAVVNYASSFLLVDKAMDKARQGIIGMSSDIDTATENLAKFDKVASGIGKVFSLSVVAMIAVLAAMVVAAIQGVSVMTDLSKAVVSVGAAYGLTRDQLALYGESLSGAGVTTYKAVEALTLMVNAGAGSTASIKGITSAALELEKYGGQAVKETAEQYKKLKEDPVKALSALRVETGLVTDAQMRNIDTLMETGERTKAVAEAEKILQDAHRTMAKSMMDDMNPLQLLWLDMTSTLKNVYQGVIELTSSSGVVVAFTSVWNGLKLTISSVWGTVKGLSTAMVAMASGDFKGAATILSEAWSEISNDAQKAVDAVSKARMGTAAGVSEVAAASKAQSDAEKVRLYNKKIEDELDKKLLSQSKKQVTQQEYINKQLDEFKKNANGATLSTENLAKATAVFGEEWKRAQPKAEKAKITQEQKDIIRGLEEQVDIENKSLGINKEYNNQMYRARLLFEKNLITQEKLQETMLMLEQQQPGYIAGLAAQKKLTEDMKKDNESILKLKEDSAKFLTDEGIKTGKIASDYSLRLSLLGKTEEQQKKITQEAELQNKLAESNNEFEKQRTKLLDDYEKAKRTANGDTLKLEYDLNDSLITLDLARAERQRIINQETAVKAAEDMQKAFDAIKSSITDVIVTALFDGGKAGSKKLRDQVVAAFRNKITVVIDAVVNTALSGGMNALGLGATAAGGASGGLGGLMSGVSSISGMATIGQGIANILPASFSSALGLTSSALQTSNAALLGGGSSANAAAQAAAQAGNASTLSSMASTAGSILSYASALNSLSEGKIGAAAGTALGQYFGGPLGAFIGGKIGAALDDAFAGETRSGASYTSSGGKSVFEKGPSGGEIAGKESRILMENAMSAISGTLKAVGSKATLTGFVAGLESSDNGKGFNYAGGTINGRGFGESMGRDGGQFKMVSQDAKTAFANYGKELSQSILEALQVTEDIPNSLKAMLESIDITSLTTEETDALLKTVNTLVQTVTGFNTAMLSLPFEYLKDLSFDTAAGLISTAGGLETLMGNLSGFYDSFYTEAEKTTILTDNTTAAFAKLGIVMPKVDENTRTWYRTEVDRLGLLDQNIEANKVAYTSALSLWKSVDTLAPAFELVDESVVTLETTIEAATDSVKPLTSVIDTLGISAIDLAEKLRQATATMVSSWANIMQARGVSSSDVTRYTAQADISAAFTQFKTTDKFGIKSAEQFSTITQDDFRNYTAEQQKLISTILVGFKSISDANNEVQSVVQSSIESSSNSVSDTTSQTVSKVLGAFDLLNASLALQATLAEASGDLIQAENVQSQQRAIILAGLNEQDPTGLLSSLQTAIYSLGDAAKQTAKDVALASTRMSWQDKVNAITQDPVALAASRAYAKQRDLAGTDDPFTKALIELSYQYEDDVAARKKQTDLMALQDEAMQNYLDAQINVLNAQKEYASVLKGTIESMKDFLSTLNGASTPLESTAKAREAFGGLAKRASTGDTSVYSELAPAARVFLDLSKSYSRTIQDYRRDEAAVRRTMNSVIQVNTAELAKLPSEVSAASDPTKEALSALRVAQEEQTRAGTVVAAMSVNQAESLARLNGSTDSLTSRYLELIATLPNGDALKTEFDTVMDKAVGDKLPEESPFTFKDVLKGVLGDKLPDGFFGVAFSAKDIFKNAIDGYIASLPRSTGSGGSSIPTGGTVALNPVGSSYAGMGSDIKTIQDLYSVNLGRVGDAAGVDFWTKAFMGDGVISAEERQQFALSAMGEYKSKLPTFDVGTNSVPTDMLASLHAGERIIPAADNTELMQRLSSPQGDNTELLGQLVMLNSRVKSLETSMIAGQVAIADNTRKTKNVLEKFDIDGLPKERV